MPDITPSRLGQNNLTGDDKALFQIRFLTRVLSYFHADAITLGRFEVENIDFGKSASFPLMGRASGGVHKVGGASVTGRKIAHGEIVIPVDDRVYADASLADVDEFMASMPMQDRYAQEMAAFMSTLNDTRNLILAVKAARSASRLPGVMPGGDRVVDAAMRTDGMALAKALFGARTILDTKKVDVKGNDTYAYLLPAQVALLVQSKDAINSLYGGQGSYADGTVVKVGGVNITKAVNFATEDFTDAATLPATVQRIFGGDTEVDVIGPKYQIDTTDSVGVIAHRSAVASVKLRDQMFEISRVHKDFGHLMTVSQLEGSDYLRPDCAVELAVA